MDAKVRSKFARSVVLCCTNPVTGAKRDLATDAGSELSRGVVAVLSKEQGLVADRPASSGLDLPPR
jgi:hypothetical protein